MHSAINTMGQNIHTYNIYMEWTGMYSALCSEMCSSVLHFLILYNIYQVPFVILGRPYPFTHYITLPFFFAVSFGGYLSFKTSFADTAPVASRNSRLPCRAMAQGIKIKKKNLSRQTIVSRLRCIYHDGIQLCRNCLCQNSALSVLLLVFSCHTSPALDLTDVSRCCEGSVCGRDRICL